MASKEDDTALLHELENLIDRHGLELVLGTVGFICRLKADHVRTNWQDHRTARVWDAAAVPIERAEYSRAVREVSQF